MAGLNDHSKKELIDAIHALYLLLDAEYDEIDEACRDVAYPEVDRTPAEILSYQLGWMKLVMGWDWDELDGKPVQMPAEGYKWNQLGALYQSFYAHNRHCSLQELRLLFRELEQQWLDWVGGLSEEELFTQGKRRWTGSKENWPMARWIHINSAAPFKTFRSKIRKWKKIHQQHLNETVR
ncbi:ClbS/DfsB family four-helix bundle protein [Paenibacillus sp. CAU 1782]